MESLGIDSGIFSQLNFWYVAAIAYLIGCIPFAIFVGYAGGIGDIRKLGSGNPGATNMARQGGKKLGAITLILDICKGMLAVYIGRKLGFPTTAAFFVVLGHCFSVFLKFKGGKGVATTLGALLILNFPTGATFAALWLIIFGTFRISSLSALCGIWLTACVAFFFWFPSLFFLTLFFAVLITVRHKSNIKKLLAGTES